MELTEYTSLLDRLPIKNPTEEDMIALCPHLTPEEAVAAFKADNNGCVAVPPLKVENAYQVIHYIKPRGMGGVNTNDPYYPEEIRWAYAGRAYFRDGRCKAEEERLCQAFKAIEFAKENWGDKLAVDNWISVLTIHIQDPTDLDKDYFPKTIRTLYVALGEDLECIIKDCSKPISELIDDVILRMSIDHRIGSEIKGGRGKYTLSSCALCGAGLSFTSCDGCHVRFGDDRSRWGWNVPLSQKMVDLLEEYGHKFAIDPEVAWEDEYRRWKEVKCFK